MSAMLFESIFEQTASSLVDAFVARARSLDK
jgi:ribosome-associated toxin RatA of RatAB toxin-antitoxin module